MWQQLVESAGAEIARLTPNTPPAVWLLWAGYAATAIGALVIAAVVLKISGSKLAAAAAAIAFAVRPASSQPGPLLFALAIFGVCFAPQTRARSWIVAMLMVAALITGTPSIISWTFAGFGLALIGDHVASRGPKGPHLRTMAIVALTLILITAPLPAASTSTPPAQKLLGYDRVTLNSFRALVSNLPSGSFFVNDDRVTGILLRAAQSDLARARVEIHSINNDPAPIRSTITSDHVFALPHAQQTLAMHGFQITDSLHTADRGLAEVTFGGRCVAAAHWWQNAPGLTGRTNLAFAASNEDERGPVVIYLAGDEPIHVEPVDWPIKTLRGFAPRTFDFSNAKDREDFERIRTEDQGPRTEDFGGAKSVTRVALWRMPDSALEMMIRLSAPAMHAAVALAPEAKNDVSVCPAFPVTVSAIR